MKNMIQLLICVLLCSGCIATAPTQPERQQASASDSPVRISSIYRTEPLGLSKLPADTALAMAGIVQLIRGEKPTVDHFTVASGIDLTEPATPLESFRLIDLTVLDRVETEMVKGTAWDSKTMAVLTFGLGPWRAMVLTEAFTTTTASGVVLQRASVRTLSPAQPRTVAWFVPKAAFNAAITGDKAWPVWDLMELANSLGTPIGQGHPPTKEPHLAVVFVLDRLEASDSVKGAVTADPAPPSWWTGFIAARAGVGFPVLTINVPEPLNLASAERFVHVSWRASDSTRTSSKADLPIGRFSTAALYPEAASQATLAAKTDRILPAPSATPKNPDNGTSPRLLNYKVKNDAVTIQAQLKKTGFYAGKVDGEFGKGSQAALAKFRKSRGLADNAVWDQATQNALFDGGGAPSR